MCEPHVSCASHLGHHNRKGCTLPQHVCISERILPLLCLSRESFLSRMMAFLNMKWWDRRNKVQLSITDFCLQSWAWNPKPVTLSATRVKFGVISSDLFLGWLLPQWSSIYHLLFPHGKHILPVPGTFMHTVLPLPSGTTLPAQAPHVPSKKFSPLKMVSSDGHPGINHPVWQVTDQAGNILCISAKKHCSTALTVGICQSSRCFTKTNCSEREESRNNRDLGVASTLA